MSKLDSQELEPVNEPEPLEKKNSRSRIGSHLGKKAGAGVAKKIMRLSRHAFF